MHRLIITAATLLSCLSLPAFAQSDRPVAKAGEPLDFGHMSDRQVNEFVASELKELKELKELNEQAALMRSALTILVTLQGYALDADAATLEPGSSTEERIQRYLKGPLPEALGNLGRNSTASDRGRASAFRVAPPK
jgi:hypothetical protein